ncbi:MAG: cyclase [Paraglaciecola psychrophila]|jgi:cyclase
MNDRIIYKVIQRLTLTAALGLVSVPALAHTGPAVPKPVSLDLLLNAFGWDMDSTAIEVQKVSDNLHVLFGVGGNIAVSVGGDGVLVVDDQFPEMMPKIKAAIKTLGGEGVDFAVNTHWHFDHAEGNLALGKEATWLVSHANSREMMLEDQIVNLVSIAYQQKAYPKEALPTLTYDSTMQFHINGEEIELLHFGPAHTTGDTAIIFRGSNAVHLGDVFNNAGYPFIDAGNGGTLAGMVKFCREVLKAIDETTTVIPGHGPVTDYQTLQQYVAMLSTTEQRMRSLIDTGATLQQVQDANITAQWDEKMGDNSGFINRAYMSLTHRIVDK